MIRKLILSLCVGFCCLACEEALPDYNTSWSGFLFVFGESLNPERFSYSFIGKEETRMMDTIWFTVRPQGLLPETLFGRLCPAEEGGFCEVCRQSVQIGTERRRGDLVDGRGYPRKAEGREATLHVHSGTS